ncbi:MAG: hypothetical protein COU67_00490 [Candidatus Pacebacteria bacterium CG10_big_fil_rev_8_21_14_0_10_44_54]|nr:MAG: hypothetical protein COU67_00490 [Candidatus Pacebacteria bacterium CG10_big_fil_rev_8_21_14_0_10_44_54]
MKTEKSKILFIAGVPGTGKTTMGDHLSKNYGFFHLDMENPPSGKWSSIYSGDYSLLDQLANGDNKIVITWGYLPDHQNILSIVERIIELKPTYIWFDGDRDSARKAFLNRNTVSEELLNIQLARINRTNIVKKWSPIIFNTFDSKGNFLSKEKIAKKLIAVMESGNEK